MLDAIYREAVHIENKSLMEMYWRKGNTNATTTPNIIHNVNFLVVNIKFTEPITAKINTINEKTVKM